MWSEPDESESDALAFEAELESDSSSESGSDGASETLASDTVGSDTLDFNGMGLKAGRFMSVVGSPLSSDKKTILI
jgi:hypothetical protein